MKEGLDLKVADLSLKDYAQIIQLYIDEECDPVDGIIETLRERYDVKGSGKCRYA
jgi:hypothetical protein